ncbi:MAG: TIGR01777 family oxidoreductase [bacterium]
MKIILAGGTGQLGKLLEKTFLEKSHHVCVISRSPSKNPNHIQWDSKNLAGWASELENADVVINLAGRSVNCRYTKKNLDEMMSSRINSTRLIGEAISKCKNPPKVWIQMSTATIYAHTYGQSHDEENGIIGGSEPDVPPYWKKSINIAKAWESELLNANTPNTRKVAIRSSMVMIPGAGGVFDVLLKMVRIGLGGSTGSGNQYISWIHGHDFIRAIEHVIQHEHLSGAINFCAPNPLPQKSFMKILRSTWGIRLGLPATKWMAEIGAFFIRTDTELLLKSRKVIPGRLLKDNFNFKYPSWDLAAKELITHYKQT